MQKSMQDASRAYQEAMVSMMTVGGCPVAGRDLRPVHRRLITVPLQKSHTW
jgi:methyl-accepting chemotaxis protein